MSCNGGCPREKAACPFSLSTLPGDCCYISLCPVWTVEPVGFAMSWPWPWLGVLDLVAPEAPPPLR